MKPLLCVLLFAVALLPLAALAQQRPLDRVGELELRVQRVEGSYKSLAGPAFLAGVIAALWAQNSKRNAWLWFFLGVLFVPITLLVLLYLNARDRRRSVASAAPAG